MLSWSLTVAVGGANFVLVFDAANLRNSTKQSISIAKMRRTTKRMIWVPKIKPIQTIPQEIVAKILSHLNRYDVEDACLASRIFARARRSNYFVPLIEPAAKDTDDDPYRFYSLGRVASIDTEGSPVETIRILFEGSKRYLTISVSPELYDQNWLEGAHHANPAEELRSLVGSRIVSIVRDKRPANISPETEVENRMDNDFIKAMIITITYGNGKTLRLVHFNLSNGFYNGCFGVGVC